MIKNYLKIAYRNLVRNKVYSALNIVGLGIGLSCFFVISLFIRHELSYDDHSNGDRIYRVIGNESNSSSGKSKTGMVNPLIASEAMEKIPAIEKYTRVWRDIGRIKLFSKLDSSLFSPATLVDPDFTTIFDIEFLLGSRESSFKKVNSALITEDEAIRVFGSAQEAMGEELSIRQDVFVIDGIVKTPPTNSSLEYTLLLPYDAVEPSLRLASSWRSYFSAQVYFLLNDQANLEEVDSGIENIFIANGVGEKGTDKIALQRLKDIHFSLDVKNDKVRAKSDRQYVLIFSGVAFFILLSAVFNFISLTLSQSVQRTKEVGVRKVIGSGRKDLFVQFFMESLLYVIVAVILAIVLAEFLIPQLEGLLERKIRGVFEYNLSLFLWVLVLVIALAAIGSIYPMVLANKKRTADMLRGGGKMMFKSHRLINGVTVFQMVVFVLLVCGVFVGKRQMEFLQNENLGFDNKNVLLLDMSSSQYLENKIEPLRNELSRISGIESISRTSQVPPGTGGVVVNDAWDYNIYNYSIDERFLETLGMELVAGRNFVATDVVISSRAMFLPKEERDKLIQNVLISETAARKFGFSPDSIGAFVNTGFIKSKVIGIVKDFHYVSKREPIDPVVFQKGSPDRARKLAIRLTPGSIKESMKSIHEVYKSVTDQANPDYHFLDEQFNQQYKQELVMTKVIDGLTIISALIAFMGLFGLSGYNASRRMKEMGIRKVLGAGFMSIQKTLNIAFLKKLLLAITIATPVVVYWMNQWLSSFAYQISPPVFILAVAILAATFFILLTTSIHSIKAFLINPVEILKDE